MHLINDDDEKQLITCLSDAESDGTVKGQTTFMFLFA